MKAQQDAAAAAAAGATRCTRVLLGALLLGALALSGGAGAGGQALLLGAAPRSAVVAVAPGGSSPRSAGAAGAAGSAASGAALGSAATAEEPSFNVIVTTAGRASLGRMLQSIAPQLAARDHLTLISDGGHAEAAAALAAAPCACAKRHIANASPLGGWGHGSRSAWQDALAGDFHMNADDDDLYDAEAMAAVRRAVAAHPARGARLFVFHMIRRWDGAVGIIPPKGTREVKDRAIGTPCGVYSKASPLPPWRQGYGGDAGFYVELSRRANVTVTFVPEVIYQCKQDEDLLAIKAAFL